jgi:hypothetical protein
MFLDSDYIIGLWNTAAPLGDFGHAISISFEANIAYSALVQFGDFKWSPLSRWLTSKKSALVGNLSETPTFDYPSEIGAVERTYSCYIERIHAIASGWAIFAAIADVLILILMPFHSDYWITGRCAAEYAVFLFFAVPFGAGGIFAIHIMSWMHLDRIARRFHDVIHYAENVVSDKIESTRKFLHRDQRPRSGDAENPAPINDDPPGSQ